MRADESSNVNHAKKHTFNVKSLRINFLSEMRVDKSSNLSHVKKYWLNTITLWINFSSKMEANIVGMNHCKVCDTVGKTASKHIENQKHRIAINNSIISNAFFNRKTGCLICYREFQNL
jgi:hypothetical protein